MSEVRTVEDTPKGLILPEWLTVSSSPHVKTNESTEKIMWSVNAALLPATAWGVYHFGLHALLVVLACIVSAVATEYIVQKVRKVAVTAFDGSAVLTGLLLALCLPPAFPLWMAALGAAFAVFIAKHTFGGLGQNIFNPAHIGRAFLLASFPVLMTTWSAIAPATNNAPADLIIDGVTTATPLGIVSEHGYEAMTAVFGSGSDLYWKLFLGEINGSIGEVSALFLLIGGLFLLIKRYISWEGPVIYIATVAVLTWISGGDPIFAMLSGGLVIGAFFMITDYVTTPITRKGQIIFAVGGGVLVWVIRTWGGYPEGVCYSILLMNCFTPLIDRVIRPKRYGVNKAKGVAA